MPRAVITEVQKFSEVEGAYTVARAEDLLAGIEEYLPVRVDYITNKDEQYRAIAVVRRSDGFLFIGPHPESESALYGDRAVLDFIGEAPGIIRELLDLLDEKEANKPSE